jgi:predicted O-methyltransferase YrrM
MGFISFGAFFMSNHFFDEGDPPRGQKVLLATPCYQTPAAAYTFSISRARQALTTAGIQSAYILLQGNPHVDDSRNSLVRDFLESDCTDLVFLDADVDFEPEALVQLCRRQLPVVGGVYPYRREGSDNMPVRLLDGAKKIVDGLLEVEGLPTGFMKIQRVVLEQMAQRAPKYFDKIYETALVFDRPTPGADKTRWGGDVDFCNRVRAAGWKIYADAELRLGHTATVVIRDSLAASIRRLSGTALAHIIPRVREGTETEADYNEAFRYCGNNYAVDAGVLAILTSVARKCRGPILETGSGLSSVFMAASTPENVYSLEHLDHYAAQTLAWAEEAGVSNVGICCAPLKDFWYDVEKFNLPNKFALGFCDGPPRLYGTRMRFFDVFAERCSVIVVDDIKTDHNYAKAVQAWAESHGRTMTLLGRAALLAKESLWQKAA